MLDKQWMLLHSSTVRFVSHASNAVELMGKLTKDKFIRVIIRIGKIMKQLQSSSVLIAALLLLVSLVSVKTVQAQSLDEVFGVRAATTVEGKRSQAKIDELKDDTRDLLSQYKRVMKVVDGLKVYNLQQERLIRNQNEELAELANSIDSVTVIERQIGPLIERMIDNLAKFVELDVPFLMGEREDRIAFLRETLDRADVSVAEKFSQVMQAYQVENAYGSTIEPYTDMINVNGKSTSVDMLKWGRVSLVFQTLNGETTGVWDNTKRDWVILGDEYRAGVRDALRIARKTKTADLVKLPVRAAGE